MAEHQHQLHFDTLDDNIQAIHHNIQAMHHGFTKLFSSCAANTLLLRQILDLLPASTNPNQPHDEPKVFDVMLKTTSDATCVFGIGENDGSELVDDISDSHDLVDAEVFDQMLDRMEPVTITSSEAVYSLVATVEVCDEMPALEITQAGEFEHVHEATPIEDNQIQSQYIFSGVIESGYLMSTKDPFIDLMGRITQNAYMVSSTAGPLLDTYEQLVEIPFMLHVFAKNPKRKTSANILFGNALSHECWQPTEFFQSKPFDPGISLTANMWIESTLNVAFVPTVTTDFFLQQILEFNSYEAHKETNLLLGTAIVDLSAKGFFVFVAMWPWGILGNDYEGFDMGRKIEEPSLWCIVDVEVKFEETCSLLFLNIEELIDADDPYRFRLLVMAHVARSVCGKRLIDSLVLAREHLASKLLVDSVDLHGREIGDATSLVLIKVAAFFKNAESVRFIQLKRLHRLNALPEFCHQAVADSMGRFVNKSSYFGRQRRYLHAFTYAQQALFSSLFFPQPCGQGCFDGDGNVMNLAATIGLVNENASNDPQGLRRSTRAKQLPGKYDDFKVQGWLPCGPIHEQE